MHITWVAFVGKTKSVWNPLLKQDLKCLYRAVSIVQLLRQCSRTAKVVDSSHTRVIICMWLSFCHRTRKRQLYHTLVYMGKTKFNIDGCNGCHETSLLTFETRRKIQIVNTPRGSKSLEVNQWSEQTMLHLVIDAFFLSVLYC